MLQFLQWPSWRREDLIDTNAHINTFFVRLCATNTALHTDTVKSMKWLVYVIQFNKMTRMRKVSLQSRSEATPPVEFCDSVFTLMFRLKHDNSRLIDDGSTSQWIMIQWLCEGSIIYFESRRERAVDNMMIMMWGFMSSDGLTYSSTFIE